MKQSEVEEVCAPIVSKYYGGAGEQREPDGEEATDEL